MSREAGSLAPGPDQQGQESSSLFTPSTAAAASRSISTPADFAAPAGHDDGANAPIDPRPHVHYALNVDTGAAAAAAASGRHSTTSAQSAPGDFDVSHSGDLNAQQNNAFTPISPLPRRRMTRVNTLRTVEDFGDIEDFEVRPGWRPGQEPGVDPDKANGGHASMIELSAPCDITVVDFAQEPENIMFHRLDNESLPPFLKVAQPKWAKCRWINVNGLSWDVIQCLGSYKKLHRLAVEDIMNIRNRTKAEWFPTHAFIVLSLQKLVHLRSLEDSDDDEQHIDGSSMASHHSSWFKKTFGGLFSSGKKKAGRGELEKGKPGVAANGQHDANGHAAGESPSPPDPPDSSSTMAQIRSLQRFHASANDPRTLFMEEHSALGSKGLGVSCEQVSIFVTDDNTVISFFEVSAQDVEAPIVRRLYTTDTILRQSCDAMMVGQAIIDAIIDLAIPVTACYGDAIDDLELDVLMRPNLSHTKRLYIMITEINKMLRFISPIVNLIQAMRDHKTPLGQDAAAQALQDPAAGVIITPMTCTYLGDVLDHCVLITESLHQLKGSADGMIDLIFNTVSASQNESMRQLTVVTIIFLPLTFMTGYFGQNFQPFTALDYGVDYFWQIAVPVVVVTILVLMKDIIFDYGKSLKQRRYVLRLRKTRRARRRTRSSHG